MIRTELQAKLIIFLSQVPMDKRTTNYFCFKTGEKYNKIAIDVGILTAGDLLRKGQHGRNVFLTPTKEAIEMAEEFLNEDEKVEDGEETT